MKIKKENLMIKAKSSHKAIITAHYQPQLIEKLFVLAVCSFN
jgi:hypothetical protein